MNDRAFNVDHPPKVFHNGLQYFDIEVHDGIGYVSLDDGYNYVATSKSMQRSQQGRHRTTVTSSVYDGEWEVHSTLGNVTETVEVYVHGADQISVTECSVEPPTFATPWCRRSASGRATHPKLAAVDTNTSVYCEQKNVPPSSTAFRTARAPLAFVEGRPNFLNW